MLEKLTLSPILSSSGTDSDLTNFAHSTIISPEISGDNPGYEENICHLYESTQRLSTEHLSQNLFHSEKESDELEVKSLQNSDLQLDDSVDSGKNSSEKHSNQVSLLMDSSDLIFIVEKTAQKNKVTKSLF